MPDDGQFGSGLDLSPAVAPPSSLGTGIPGALSGFGSAMQGIFGGPRYAPPDPQTSPLDQSAALLQQRVKRANEIATNPVAQFFAPEQVQAARNFVPKAVEQLQTIEKQKADIVAGRREAQALGLDPGEVSDQATHEDRVVAAQTRALRGDLKAFQGLQARDPKAAEAIQEQVHSAVAANLTAAQEGFDVLSNARNQGEYAAALVKLRRGGDIAGLESLGLKVPATFEQFGAARGREAEALRNARAGVDTIGQKLEARNTAQPMEKKEAETYKGAWKTVYGDDIEGQPSRVGASGARMNVIDRYDDPRKLGRGAVLASPEQRTAIKEEFNSVVPKEDMEKFRSFNRISYIATHDPDGKEIPSTGAKNDKGEVRFLNTNPNVQQGVAEGLAFMLRGGAGGANGQLMRLELAKRGWTQGAADSFVSNWNGAWNTLFRDANKEGAPYQTQRTQKQIRDVIDALHAAESFEIGDRVGPVAKRAGALGLDSAAFGFGKNEATGVIADSLEEGRQAQIAVDMQRHQAIGGGRGALLYGALTPANNAQTLPEGTERRNQLTGGLQTPVQQAMNPRPAAPPSAAPPGSLGVVIPPITGPGGPPSNQPPVAPNGGPGLPVAAPPTGGPTPGRNNLPPGMPLDSPAAVDATANRIIQLESGFRPGQKTGSYVGLGQWSKEEMQRHGITNPDDLEQTRTALKADIERRTVKLQKDGFPATAANVYLMHQQGEAGLEAHLRNPDKPAWENVRFGYRTDAIAKRAIWGNMTPYMHEQFPGGVEWERLSDSEKKVTPPPEAAMKEITSGDFTRLWEARVNSTDKGGTGATVEARGALGLPREPTLATNARTAPRFVSGTRRDVAEDNRTWTDVAIEHGPAIGGIGGMVAGGAAGGPVGAAAGSAAGSGAGQVLKDYLQGRPQNPTEIAKQTALGGVLGVFPEGRPVVGAAARALGAGAVEAGGAALEGGDTEDVTKAAVKGAGSAAGGEAFGRALGMAGHKVWKMFSPDAKKAVIDAAKAHADAEEVLRTEQPKLLNAVGSSSGPNPKYVAAEAAKEKAETTLKDAGLNPEEAAYAHRATEAGTPRDEAIARRPGDIEQRQLGAGYQQLEQELPPRKGMKAATTTSTEPLAKGPLIAFENGDVVKSKTNQELAQHVEAAITAPAKTWAEKWNQLKDARTDLLQAERDAMTSTAAGRTQTAKDMRTFADTVRTQQEKVAEYVFGKRDGAAFIDRLKVLDTRYAKLMDATNGGKLAEAAAMKGEAGREAEKRFVAFAAGDPDAIRAYRAMRGVKGNPFEATVPWTVAAEGIPVIGKGIKVAKLAGMLNELVARKAAGDPVKFRDLVKLPHDENGRLIRNVAGGVGAHTAVSATESPVPGAQIGKDADGNPGWFIPDPARPGKHLQIMAK
jgi:hypothetical protein